MRSFIAKFAIWRSTAGKPCGFIAKKLDTNMKLYPLVYPIRNILYWQSKTTTSHNSFLLKKKDVILKKKLLLYFVVFFSQILSPFFALCFFSNLLLSRKLLPTSHDHISRNVSSYIDRSHLHPFFSMNLNRRSIFSRVRVEWDREGSFYVIILQRRQSLKTSCNLESIRNNRMRYTRVS